MSAEHFVGRDDAVKRLKHVLIGQESASGKMTVQGIDGPGGIGKTFLFNHVFAGADLSDRNYLTLRIDGNEPSARGLVRAIARMVDSADAEALRDQPSGYYFPNVDQVVTAVETIRAEAIEEFKKQHPNDDDSRLALLRLFDLAIEAGVRINDAIPITREHVDFQSLNAAKRAIEETVPVMVSLREEVTGFGERLGLWGTAGLRNSIKENACRPLADALTSDLSAILYRPKSQDWWKPTHRKIAGIDRLLLIIDDYEVLQHSLGEFLVAHFLPALRSVNFQSVVIILGRDQLEATHPAWDQHLKPNLLKRIALNPLSRTEMDQLVESYGVASGDEKDRVWRDTEGYPFYVQLWIEEMDAGGRSAVMLKRFYDRTTRWMSDRERAWLDKCLFLNKVNIRTLQRMLGNEVEAEQAFRWFEREGSVRDTVGSSFHVREYLRSRLVDYLQVSDPDRCQQLQHAAELAMNGQS